MGAALRFSCYASGAGSFRQNGEHMSEWRKAHNHNGDMVEVGPSKIGRGFFTLRVTSPDGKDASAVMTLSLTDWSSITAVVREVANAPGEPAPAESP
jgi:hypothetical protein